MLPHFEQFEKTVVDSYQSWNPHYMYLIDDLEKVQKRATKILRQCLNFPAASGIFESTNTGI